MKKKGIILLITIFFITAITALYIKNLSDSDRLIKQSQNIYHMNYIIKIAEDVTGVIETLNKKYQEIEFSEDFISKFILFTR